MKIYIWIMKKVSALLLQCRSFEATRTYAFNLPDI